MSDKFDILGQAQQNREKEQMLAFRKAVEDSPYIVCSCGNGTYVTANFLKNVSGLRTGNGVDMIVPQQIFICANCGSIISGYEENILVDPSKFDVKNGMELKEQPKTDPTPKNTEESNPPTSMELL